MNAEITLIDDGRATVTGCQITADTVRLTRDSIHSSVGWELRDEGLCRGDQCIPAPDLLSEGGVDLSALAAALRRPLALDVEERAAALGTAVEERAAGLADLMAPHFELPDLEGRLHSLSQHRGKKVLLVAYASW